MLETRAMAELPSEQRVRGDRPELGESSVQGKEDERQLSGRKVQLRPPALLDLTLPSIHQAPAASPISTPLCISV